MKKILIADDDKAHRTMLKANLAGAGYDIVETADGDQVLPVLAGNDVDLILLDLKMARMDGLELPPQVLPDNFTIDSTTEILKNGLTLKDMEKEAIRTTLKQIEGNKPQTAKLLGIARQTLLNKIKEYGL